jgi:hypothetical protein
MEEYTKYTHAPFQYEIKGEVLNRFQLISNSFKLLALQLVLVGSSCFQLISASSNGLQLLAASCILIATPFSPCLRSFLIFIEF